MKAKGVNKKVNVNFLKEIFTVEQIKAMAECMNDKDRIFCHGNGRKPYSGSYIFFNGYCFYGIDAVANMEYENTGIRDRNVGVSDYSKRKIQPWDIWLEYNLNPWDADIIKRVLRVKEGEPRTLDYEKIIHICEERLRQLKRQQSNG